MALALAVPALVGQTGVGADHMESTDTTTAGAGGSSRDHSPPDQPPNCTHGEVTLGDGTVKCRFCTNKTHFYDPTKGRCVPKMESDEDDPACTPMEIADGNTVYFSSYGGCRPQHCPGGRTPEGFCAPPSTTTPTPATPTGQKANGDSRGVEVGEDENETYKGQSVVTWDAAGNATGYTVRHEPGACDARGRCNPYSTHNLSGVANTSITLPSLKLDTFHTSLLQLREDPGRRRRLLYTRIRPVIRSRGVLVLWSLIR